MDADWGQMRAEAAPANAELYANTLFGIQGTGGSTAIASSYDVMRRAGAAARAMLVGAAAEAWSVPEAEITVLPGRDRARGFWQLVGLRRAGERPPRGARAAGGARAQGPLAVRADRQERAAARQPGQVHRAGRLQPRRLPRRDADGGRCAPALLRGHGWAPSTTRRRSLVPGVERVERIPQGIAVYARSTYPALMGRDALAVTWDESAAETRSSDEMFEVWSAAAQAAGREVERSGDVDAAFEGADRVLEAEYRFPFLAHAPMEPLDGVIELSDGAAEIWMGSQLQRRWTTAPSRRCWACRRSRWSSTPPSPAAASGGRRSPPRTSPRSWARSRAPPAPAPTS